MIDHKLAPYGALLLRVSMGLLFILHGLYCTVETVIKIHWRCHAYGSRRHYHTPQSKVWAPTLMVDLSLG
jgi:hypothetical protein